MIKVIVAGSRNFNNYELLRNKLDKILANKKDVEIVSGTAKGADKLGERYANEHNYKIAKFPAKWEVYGKRAGYARNKEMSEYADCCVVFWDGVSKGSKHMIDLAIEQNLQLRVIKY